MKVIKGGKTGPAHKFKIKAKQASDDDSTIFLFGCAADGCDRLRILKSIKGGKAKK